jgi:arginase
VNVDLIAVPFDSGQRDVRMGRGPGHLLDAGIVEALERAGANVKVKIAEPATQSFATEISTSFELQRVVAAHVARALLSKSFPIVLSGNCNTAVGTVAGLTAVYGTTPAVCWLDAHGDFNTPETTKTGFLDGMAVAMVDGRCWRALTSGVPGFIPVPDSQILMIGARDLDEPEAINLELAQVKRSPIAEALSAVQSINPKQIYMHVDLDVFDLSEGTANGFAVKGGISRDDFMKFAGDLKGQFQIGAAAITAYDPSCDPENRIARLAVDIARALATGEGLSRSASVSARAGRTARAPRRH